MEANTTDESVSSASNVTDCDLVVAALEQEGIEVAFGIPGTHNLGLYAALHRGHIRHVAPRHEQGGGYAADGYARSTGRPALLITTSGPGASNACTSLGTAYADSVPILMIAAGMRTGTVGAGLGQLHELKDQFAHISAIVHRSHRATEGRDAAAFIHSVFAEWRAGRRRPAYLEIPYDVVARSATEHSGMCQAGTDPLGFVPPARHDLSTTAEIKRAAELVGQSKAPVLVLGGGARSAGVEATAFSELAEAVVITTSAGKGCVPETHPNTLGATIDLPAARQAMEEADLVIVVGSELAESELGPNDWHPGAPVLRVDIDAEQLRSRWNPTCAISLDAAQFFNQLTRLLRGHEHPAPHVASAKERAERARSEIDAQIDQVGAAWAEINLALSTALPTDTIVAGDSSQVSYRGTMYRWPMPHPGSFLYPAGFATLGYGLPAAIGAKIGNPDRPVIVLQGDGGLMFSIQELMTAIEERLSIPIVVMNNGGYAEIREQMHELAIAPLGTDLRMPDFAALAIACGARGVRAEDAEDATRYVVEALGRDRPTLIEVRV